MFGNVNQIVPKVLADELLRLARIDREWIEVVPLVPPQYIARCKYNTWLKKLWSSGSDAFGMWASSIWLVDGPKVFRPTPEQCQALSQIEVRLELSEYSQPYPAILVDLPSGYEPFTSVICFKHSGVATFSLNSINNENDIVTTVSIDNRPMEESLQKFDEDCRKHSAVSSKVLRIACNACLALSSYETMSEYLYPKEVARDAGLAKEKSERGARAKERVDAAPILVKFKQDVVLHRTETVRSSGEPTGREMSSHWRRGHWAMQPYGPAKSLRKRILRAPVFVRADKFLGDVSDTSTTYTTRRQNAESPTTKNATEGDGQTSPATTTGAATA